MNTQHPKNDLGCDVMEISNQYYIYFFLICIPIVKDPFSRSKVTDIQIWLFKGNNDKGSFCRLWFEYDYLLSGGIQLEYSFRSDCYEHTTPAKWSRMRCYGNFQSIKHLLLDLHSNCERSVLKIESDRDIGQSNMIHLVFYKMFKENIDKGSFCRVWFEYRLSFERGNTTWI